MPTLHFFSITDEFRIAFQFLSEKIERSASLFRLLHETVVSFVFIQQDGIVDMGDGMSLGCELLAQQNILIAVVSEVLIKGAGEQDVSGDKEIGASEFPVAFFLSMLIIVSRLACLFVSVSQVMIQGFSISANLESAHDDVAFCLQIVQQKVRMVYMQVAIH